MVKKLVFYGTSDICLPFLDQLHAQFDLSLIVTQPDSIGGRKRKTIVPAAKSFALDNGIPVIQPITLKDDAVIEEIRSHQPDLGVVISYGRLIPKSVFRIPVHRTINVHFSMLPHYRGAAPVQRALENGDPSSGITIFEIIRKLDAGPIWSQMPMDILPNDTTQTLWDRMSQAGTPFLCDTINGITDQNLEKQSQNHEQATLAPPVKKEEGDVDWSLTAHQLYNKFRAFTPWPGICCTVCGKLIKLIKIKVSDLSHDQQPGDVMEINKKYLRICCGEGSVLDVLELQPQGKKPMTPFCYCQGNQLPECLA
jgi:methionyl-tRNA formyltransferase